MADIVGVDAGGAPDGLFERKHDRHPIEAASQGCGALRAPGPYLRRTIPEHADSVRVKPGRESRVELGVVDEQSSAWAAVAHRSCHQTPTAQHAACASAWPADAHGRQRAEIAYEIGSTTCQGRTTEPKSANPVQLSEDSGCRSVARGFSSDHEQRGHGRAPSPKRA